MKKLSHSIVFKIIMGIIILMNVFFLAAGYIGYQGFTRLLLHVYEDGAYRTAVTASQLVDVERLDAYAASGGQTEEYKTVLDDLDWLCNAQNVTFVYVIQPDLKDYNHITFLFSAINRNADFTLYDFGFVRQTTNDDYRQAYRELYEGKADRAFVVRDKGFIETEPHITGIIPLKGNDGKTKALMCVQRQMSSMNRVRNEYVRRVFLVLIAMMVVTITILIFYVQRTLLMPIKTITEEAARFARENVEPKVKLTDTIQNQDEVGELALSVEKMEKQIHDYIENITRITEERGRMDTELNLAARIQANMLPSVFPPFPDKKEIDIYATMYPAREVGGDFYDFFMIDEDRLGLVIADVSGKGIPAALFMMMSKILIQNYTLSGMAPSAVLESINTQICRNNQEEMFITVWLGILDLRTGELTASNAGHEYPIIREPDGRFEIFRDKHGFVIGGMEGMKYRDYVLRLQPGAILYVYTDGVPEATDSSGRLYGMERTLDALNEIRDPEPEGILKEMNTVLDRFIEGTPRFDDTTMLCVRYNGRKPEKGVEMTVQAVTDNIPAVTDFVTAELEKYDCPPKAQMQIKVGS